MPVSRREFTQTTLGALFLPAETSSDVFDEALDLLKDSGPEFGGGLANHGPMAAEALVALGRPEAVVPWVRSYRRRLDSPPASWKPVTDADWRGALGDERRAADWPRFFERKLEEKPWPEVLDAWVRELAPGFVAAAFHGILRAGHAARALSSRDTPARRRELAAGLGYWAMRFQRLPEAKAPSAPRLAIGDALQAVPVLPLERRRGGLITAGLAPLADFPPFAPVIDLADTAGDPARVLSDITGTFASAYLADGGRSLFAFIHALTGPSALRLLLPHLSPGTSKSALRYAWQAAAAIYAAFARPETAPALEPAGEVPDLITEGVDTGDEHAIKFTEACLREHRVSPAPEFLAAARDACRRLR